MQNKQRLRAFLVVGLAILLGVVLTVLSAIPPLSLAYQWLEQHDLPIIWYGLEAGVISLCVLYYLKR